MNHDDHASDLLTAMCVCRGSGVVHIGTDPVPCPDCGDV